MEYEQIDEALLPMHELLVELSTVLAGYEDPVEGVRMELEALGIEMPLVLDISLREDGSIALGAAPPLYYLETTVEQVHHPVKLRIVKEATA